jgi:hypothetical protein
VAIRMGDVTGDVTPTFTGNPGDDRFGSDETFRFRIAEQPVRAGETITVPFKASDFNGRLAYQMTIGFDSDVLELTDIQPGVLPGLKTDNFGTAALAAGKLTTVWVSREPVTIADDEVLFTLTFRSLRAAPGLAQMLHAGSTPTPATAVDGDGNTMKIDFDFVQPEGGLEPARFALYQNQPNPFRGQTTIGFRLPESSRGTLRVYTVGGQLVKTVVGQFDKGYNEIRFQRDELGTPGVYWYELETPAHSDRKKMILID